MTEEQFLNEKRYQTTMSNARKLLRDGAISEEEYYAFETIMLAKYHPILGRLFSDIL